MKLHRQSAVGPGLAILLLALATLACGAGVNEQNVRIPTPAPGGRATPRGGDILPATTSPWSVATLPPAVIAVTATPTLRPTVTRAAPTAVATRLATATRQAATAVIVPTATPRPDPTPDPNLVIVTEADITAAVTSGATASAGLVVQGLAVRFSSDGKTRLTADRLGYGILQAQNLTIVGRLTAQNGALQLQTESISPENLVTVLVPALANQALAQYTAQWYIEEVRTLDGRLEIRIR